eukprot:231845-Pyramimonas_sp.AAC.1
MIPTGPVIPEGFEKPVPWLLSASELKKIEWLLTQMGESKVFAKKLKPSPKAKPSSKKRSKAGAQQLKETLTATVQTNADGGAEREKYWADDVLLLWQTILADSQEQHKHELAEYNER